MTHQKLIIASYLVILASLLLASFRSTVLEPLFALSGAVAMLSLCASPFFLFKCITTVKNDKKGFAEVAYVVASVFLVILLAVVFWAFRYQ